MATLSEPVVVLYKSNVCRHCTTLSNIWDTPPNKDEDSVVSALKKVNPKIRTVIVTSKDNSGKFDENTAPKDLLRYAKWFPMILLVPGRVWDAAMAQLGPKNEVPVVDGVQIMNAIKVDDKFEYAQKYDIRKPSEFSRWLKDCLETDDFKRVQSNTGIIVPTVPTKPIQSAISNFIKPINGNYIQASGSTDGGDICSMRIIPRNK